MKLMRILTGVALCFSFLVPVHAAGNGGEHPPVAKQGPPTDDWYALYVGENKAGWFHIVIEILPSTTGSHWLTKTNMHMDISRLGQKMSVIQSSEIEEDAHGHVVRFSTSMTMGGCPRVVKGTVEAGKIHLTGQAGAEQVIDYPNGALGPVAVDEKYFGKNLEPGTVLAAPMFMAESPSQVVTATLTIGKKQKKDVLGRVRDLVPVTMKMDVLPIETVTLVDENDNALVIEMDMPFLGKVEMYETAEESARAPSKPTEVFAQSLIRMVSPIPWPRMLQHAAYLIGSKDGKTPDLLEGERQKIIWKHDGLLELDVSADPPGPDFEPFTLPVKDPNKAAYLASSAYVEAKDTEVQKLAKEAVGSTKDALQAAQRIQYFVARKIAKKDLKVGFASAAEVARNLEGDCTEHAVLCCAMARAIGLPARVVMGVVYVPPTLVSALLGDNGSFVSHMWAEALVGKNHWQPMDAAIGTWDATHIVFAKSDMNLVNPLLNLMSPALELGGKLSIQLIEEHEAGPH